MKIIYAGNNTIGSSVQAERICQALNSHSVKIAGYSFYHINLDWTLDCLNTNKITFSNSNFKRLYSQIEHYKPDLVISDYNFYFSYIAIKLKIKLYQVSSLIAWDFADPVFKSKLNLYKYNKKLFEGNWRTVANMSSVIENSDKLFCYSPFSDYYKVINLPSSISWVDPYVLDKQPVLSKYDNCYPFIIQNKNILHSIKNTNTLLYGSCDEQFNVIKNKYTNEKYNYGLIASDNLYCSGETSFIADGLYNNKNLHLFKVNDLESLINIQYYEYFKPSNKILKNKKLHDVI
jgi:hypothetical protein